MLIFGHVTEHQASSLTMPRVSSVRAWRASQAGLGLGVQDGPRQPNLGRKYPPKIIRKIMKLPVHLSLGWRNHLLSPIGKASSVKKRKVIKNALFWRGSLTTSCNRWGRIWRKEVGLRERQMHQDKKVCQAANLIFTSLQKCLLCGSCGCGSEALLRIAEGFFPGRSNLFLRV